MHGGCVSGHVAAIANVQASTMCHRAIVTVQAFAMVQASAMCHRGIPTVQAPAFCDCQKLSRAGVSSRCIVDGERACQ